VDLACGQVLEPCPGRIAEVQGQVADDDLVAGGPAQLARQTVVVEPHAGIRLPIVLDDGQGLAEALGEGRRADLPAEHAGPRGLRRRRAVFVAVVASTPSRVVAHRCPRVRLARAPGVDVRLDRPSDVISENVLHATVIRCTRVSEAERHRDITEHPEQRDERSRELVGLLHLYFMIPGVGIKEAEQLTPSR
jgi:hypothetical protein